MSMGAVPKKTAGGQAWQWAAPHGLLNRGVCLPSLREARRVFNHSGPFGTPGERGRGGDDGVDLLGIIERAPDHQRLCDCKNRRAVLGDKRLGLRKPERQIGIDRGVAGADHRGDIACFADIATWRSQPRRASGARLVRVNILLRPGRLVLVFTISRKSMGAPHVHEGSSRL
jgi:hypothetical protein